MLPRAFACRPASRTTSRRRAATVAALAAVAACVPAVRPADAAAQSPPGYTMTAFDPQQHSFRFANAWNTGDLSVRLPVVGNVDFASVLYGLCGGMSFAALDSMEADLVVPQEQTTEPADGSPLREYIWTRQIQSLTLGNAIALRRFLEWQLIPLADRRVLGVRVTVGLRTLTRQQFVNQIRPRLRDGEPVPLGLVNAYGVQAPWENHQVLAIGYRNRPNGHSSIAVYDPNYPIGADADGITYLHTSNRRQTQGPEPGDTRAKEGRFRGIFRAPYQSATPPAPPWSEPAPNPPVLPTLPLPPIDVGGRLPRL